MNVRTMKEVTGEEGREGREGRAEVYRGGSEVEHDDPACEQN